MIRVEDNTIHVDTKTLTAEMTRGWLTSLRRKSDGAELLPSAGEAAARGAALELVYRGGEVVPLDPGRLGEVVCRRVSDGAAEVRLHSWDGDGVLFVSVDEATGDLVVEPSAYSSRGGIRSCRWNVAGFAEDLELVAPFFQGTQLPLDDPLLRETHWPWPHRWEAAMAILQGRSGGLWVHTRDTQYRFKALKVGSQANPRCLGLDSEAFGPIDNNLSAGGLAWRINVHEGDWRTPAGLYRDWWYAAWGLAAAEANRRPWIHDVRLALSWCPTDAAILEALAEVLAPPKILLHVPNWRTDAYDENYPDYVASEAGRAFLARAREMGFRVMPHFNAIDMDPTNGVYAEVRDFEFREVESRRLMGWAWAGGRAFGPAGSNRALGRNRDKKTMVKIHPGLGMWRSILGERIQRAAEDLSLEAAFIDVTLCIFNLANCFVDGQTPSEGMARLIEHVGGLGGGLVVGGEGLNEVTARGLSFAQVHQFMTWSARPEDMARAGRAAVNQFLFGRLCRTIGYHHLSGQEEGDLYRMRLDADLGAIPTLTIRQAEEIRQPNPAARELLDRARET